MALLFQSTLFSDSNIVILLGPPGVGKGTHSTPLSKNLNLPHISTGNLFREHLEKDTYLGKKAKNFIQQGELVPDSLVLDILFDRISKPDCEKGYILDGFPRTVSQAKSLEKKLQQQDKVKVIYLTSDEDLLIERVTGRLSCLNCSAIFHKTFAPPEKENTCNHCGKSLHQRNDDTKEVFKKRLQVYQDQTNPLIEYYRNKKNLIEINVERSKPKEEIFEEILSALKLKISV